MLTYGEFLTWITSKFIRTCQGLVIKLMASEIRYFEVQIQAQPVTDNVKTSLN